MSESRRIGNFRVRCKPYGDYKMLEAAQRGCAVLRCEYLAHMDEFDIIAEHPDFEDVQRWLVVPNYEVEMTTDLNGDPIRKRFVIL